MPSRIEQEKQTVERMVRLYCRKKEGNKQLCPRCEELLGYARIRLSRCPFGENKSTCRQCSIHCYKPEMKERMRKVMRYAGPRMLLYHPVAALCHLWQEYVNLAFVRDVDRQALTLSVRHKKCPHLALGAYHLTHHQLK